MAEKSEQPRKISTDNEESKKILDESQDHFTQSDKYIDPLRAEWDTKEAILLGQPTDSMTQKAKSKINDPRLSTIVFERSARVMNRPAIGRAYAESRDDVGKNMFMNMLLTHYRNKDDDQYSHLLKMRFMNMYSHVYGSNFGLVPWRVNAKTGFVGPAFNVLRMRDSFPQPGVSLSDADYFDHRTWVGIDWLLAQDERYWNMDEIKALQDELKQEKDSGDTRDRNTNQAQSFIERSRYPNTSGGSVQFPQVEIITEYQRDKWITWTPQRVNQDTSRPHILRIVENPYPEGRLPIVVKHSFPLIDSPIGLGEYERGQTLQMAMNSLINLYMDSVKYSIFPPVMVDPNNVVPSSIKWGAGERWYMNTPGRDVQPLQLSPAGLSTFSSTYDFLLGALNNQSGTTSVAGEGGGTGLGNTPEAIRYVADRESARDEWDRFMQEDLIQQVYDRWIPLITNNLQDSVPLRLFGSEYKQISQRYPDVKDLFQVSKSGERAEANVSNKELGGPSQKYTWVIQTGSTSKPSLEADGEAITDVLKAVIENGDKFEAALNKKGKTLDTGELLSEWLEARNVRGLDRIITDLPQATEETKSTTQIPEMVPAVGGGVIEQPPIPPEGALPPEQAPVAPQVQAPEGVPEVQVPEFRDPQISALVSDLFGGLPGIPPTTPA